ncbi:MAG: cyclic nucleotide-binding domain-containing protein [Leptospiraceae bacterium]|nr:cyclic nucleotide-binding domain-containing protein [Leptospiraceae bacterium]
MPKGRSYTGGSIVYFQNDVGNDIYVLQKGKVILLSTALDTGEEIREEVKLGEFFGVKSALGNYPREETAQTIGATQVIVFSAAEFEAYCLRNTRLIMTMARVFSKQLRHIHKQVREILHADAVINPAFELLNVAESFYQSGHMEHAVYAFQRYLEYNPSGNNVKRAEDLLQMARKGLSYPVGYPPAVAEEMPGDANMLSDISRGMADASTAIDNPEALQSMGSRQSNPAEQIENIFGEAQAALDKKDYDKALPLFEKCSRYSNLRNAKESDMYAKAHFECGYIKLETGHYDEAQQLLSAYIKNFPTGSEIKRSIFFMGIAAQKMRSLDRARTLFAKAATMPPPDDVSREAQKRMEELG